MKPCPNCQAEVPDAVDWCPSCKRPTTAEPSSTKRGMVPRDWLFVAAPFTVLAALVGIGEGPQWAVTLLSSVAGFALLAAGVGYGVAAGLAQRGR